MESLLADGGIMIVSGVILLGAALLLFCQQPGINKAAKKAEDELEKEIEDRKNEAINSSTLWRNLSEGTMKIQLIFLDEIMVEACRAAPNDELLSAIRVEIARWANKDPDFKLMISDALYAFLAGLAQQTQEPDVAHWMQVVDAMVRSDNV